MSKPREHKQKESIPRDPQGRFVKSIAKSLPTYLEVQKHL